MEIGSEDVEGGDFFVGYDDPFRIGVGVEFAQDFQAGLGRRRGDEVDDDLVADQGAGAPVHGDEREQAVLDLVPLACSRREMMDLNLDAEFVGEALQFELPQAHA